MKNRMILVHGTWGTSQDWQYIQDDLAGLGFDILALNLLHHDLPYKEAGEMVKDLSLQAYADQVQKLVENCPQPPILVGHFLGCLVVQMVAQKTDLAGLILLGPAPNADIFAFYPSMVLAFLPHFLRWGFWRKAIPPYKHAVRLAHDQHDFQHVEAALDHFVPDSGKAYTQVALPFLDPEATTAIDYKKVSCPVLIIVGQHDKLTVPAIARAIGEKYGSQATVYLSGEADHMTIGPNFKDQTTSLIKRWLDQEEVV
ncbi:acetoin dehydrogenase E2 subunit dihydrolipoyllysine-residue acetyltransferase [Alloiococcus otitis]|uniref:AB hydrolase-1 domain-containing protein n=2 Tax=Alloiococcus TaxID=1651 RepID=K9EW70_9LACT|nr:alpha/beta hydrolase [Alloiococcus otitis]EKU93430.1 hypothetical protein HMPREF9698_00962 [Alloiococcus otitis ATCC 51267]SUU81431.1 acetoin dehydrogenase E2 subunit dihydrolipoyllysine-residue acetyltransferase [Alloiococcus otitis]